MISLHSINKIFSYNFIGHFKCVTVYSCTPQKRELHAVLILYILYILYASDDDKTKDEFVIGVTSYENNLLDTSTKIDISVEIQSLVSNDSNSCMMMYS